MNWAYGITTVPQRYDDLFPKSLASLARAGFDRPRLFVDGVSDDCAYRKFNLEVTIRSPAIRTFGNWALALAELYIRSPGADRYAIFQDDLITYANLRQYLERCEYPEKGYWNLYTFPQNQAICPKDEEGREKVGWYEASKLHRGKGAVGLVFSNQAVVTLLGQPHFVERPKHARRGWRGIDGGVVTAFNKIGWSEYVHNPSLLQHTGDFSTSQNRRHPKAPSFVSEDFDALTLCG